MNRHEGCYAHILFSSDIFKRGSHHLYDEIAVKIAKQKTKRKGHDAQKLQKAGSVKQQKEEEGENEEEEEYDEDFDIPDES